MWPRQNAWFCRGHFRFYYLESKVHFNPYTFNQFRETKMVARVKHHCSFRPVKCKVRVMPSLYCASHFVMFMTSLKPSSLRNGDRFICENISPDYGLFALKTYCTIIMKRFTGRISITSMDGNECNFTSQNPLGQTAFDICDKTYNALLAPVQRNHLNNGFSLNTSLIYLQGLHKNQH